MPGDEEDKPFTSTSASPQEKRFRITLRLFELEAASSIPNTRLSKQLRNALLNAFHNDKGIESDGRLMSLMQPSYLVLYPIAQQVDLEDAGAQRQLQTRASACQHH